MPVISRGFTLPELLVALLLSAVVLSGASRAIPALQRGVMSASARLTATRELAQLATMLGKSLQRAGYCAGQCSGAALVIEAGADCLFLVWDDNHNGRWEAAEFRGYRLRNASLEVHPGAGRCRDSLGWERVSDPASLAITQWRVTREPRPGWPVRVRQLLTAYPVVNGQRQGTALSLDYGITGFNL